MRGLHLIAGLALALSGCDPRNWIAGNVKGKPAFRVAGALIFAPFSTHAQLSSVGNAEQCASLARNVGLGSVILLSNLPAVVGVPTAVITDQSARSGARGPVVMYMGSADREFISEFNWTGSILVSARSENELAGSFDLTAGESTLAGAFSAERCPPVSP